MKPETRIIRDFIYLDADRLYSLYSQISEGVAEQIIKSYESSKVQTDLSKGLPIGGKSLEQQVGEASQRTESTILHDHLYSQMEDKLKNMIEEPANLSNETYDTALRETAIIRITGEARIQDYDRLYNLINNFNELGDKLSRLTINSEDNRFKVTVLKRMIKEEQDRDSKRFYESLLKQFSDPKEFAKANNLFLDENLRYVLKAFTELFAYQAFHVIVARPTKDANVAFCAVINKSWLRVSPDLLRALYAGNAVSNLTIVGQITHIPKKEVAPAVEVPKVSSDVQEVQTQDERHEQSIQEEMLEDAESTKEVNVEKQTSQEIRSGLNTLFNAMSGLDEMFFVGKDPVEISVSPIAIYREIKVPNIAPAKAE